jgi:beta-lactamase class A
MTRIFIILISILFLSACSKEKPAKLPVVSIYEVDTAAMLNLESELLALSKESNGAVGISAYFGDSELSLHINESEFFPLASVYKVPIVATLLAKVDAGLMNFDTLIRLTLEDRRHSGCFMDDSTYQNSYEISARALCHEMLTVSDNCATDAILRLVGGPKAVREQLKLWDMAGININRYLIEIFADLVGKKMPENQQTWTFSLINQILASSNYKLRLAARAQFWKDVRDNGSTDGFIRFHRALHDGLLLSATSTKWICETMSICRTGKEMVPAAPEGCLLAHKTGSLPGIFNDAGWLDKGGHHRPMYYAVFMKASTRKQDDDKELIMKIITKLFLFEPLKKVQ